MKIRDIIILTLCTFLALLIITLSGAARVGALSGLTLAQNTIIPSLLPLLIIFYFIMKSGAADMLSRYLGFISSGFFNLPQNTLPAIIFGLIGGYPTGALLTDELLSNGSIDKKQARQLLRFNMCGGCGFIITAVGNATFGSTKIGVMLFVSNVLAALSFGFILSFTEKRSREPFYSYSEQVSVGDALTSATSSSIKAVLNITAYIMLFSAIKGIISLPDFLVPAFEITGGICSGKAPPLDITAMLLSFGGLCIHLQLLPVILKAGMNYFDFFICRLINALFSYGYMRLILRLFPVESYVFSNASGTVAAVSSVNTALSVLLVIGCFVIVNDIYSRIKA